MATWKEDIIQALKNLGGKAHRSKLHKEVAKEEALIWLQEQFDKCFTIEKDNNIQTTMNIPCKFQSNPTTKTPTSIWVRLYLRVQMYPFGREHLYPV